LSGAVTDFTDFESGMNGWTEITPSGLSCGFSSIQRIIDCGTVTFNWSPVPMASGYRVKRDGVVISAPTPSRRPPSRILRRGPGSDAT